MRLSPWDNPHTLTRAWCLWEVYCSVEGGANFSVAFGPAERKSFEAALCDPNTLTNFDPITDAFATIDVENARAGNPADEKMIKDTVRALQPSSDGGLSGFDLINSVAMRQMERWYFSEMQRVLDGHRVDGSLTELGLQLANTIAIALINRGQKVEARQLFVEAAAASEQLHGPLHWRTLQSKQNVAEFLKDTEGPTAETREKFAELIPLCEACEQLGARHNWTLQVKLNLGVVQRGLGELESARTIIDDVINIAAETLKSSADEPVTENSTHQNTAKRALLLTAKEELAILFKMQAERPRSDNERDEKAHAAVALYSELLLLLKDSVGEKHNRSLQCKLNFANVLAMPWSGRDGARAQELYTAVCAGFEVQYGAGHPSTLVAKVNFAIFLKAEGDATGANTLFQQVVSSSAANLKDAGWYTYAAKEVESFAQ